MNKNKAQQKKQTKKKQLEYIPLQHTGTIVLNSTIKNYKLSIELKLCDMKLKTSKVNTRSNDET